MGSIPSNIVTDACHADKKLVTWITNRTPSHDSNDKLQLLPTKLLHYGSGKRTWRTNQVSNYCFELSILQSLIYCKMKVCKDNKDSMQNRRNKNNNWKFDLAWNFSAASHMPD